MYQPLLASACLAGLVACGDVRALIVENYPNAWAPEGGADLAVAAVVTGRIEGPDADRPALPVGLQPVITGLAQPTDIQFPPGRADVAVVLEKGGTARLFQVPSGQGRGVLLSLDVETDSEQGLLGLAFHPAFGPTGGKLVTHAVVAKGRQDVSQVSEWTVAIDAGGTWTAGAPRLLLELPQPYANHNAGQVAYGPDGMLYIGYGDGGWRDDPHGNGQDPTTWLGAMLRIDPDHPGDGRPYGIPADNPFLDRPGRPPEIWATGLRNPWRFSFDPRGRMVVADVGQNLWEEVDLVQAGDNLGWNLREARHCFPPDTPCKDADTLGMVDPIWEYAHPDDGISITGGYVYLGAALPDLKGRYVVGDFGSGRLWALDLPATRSNTAPLATAHALGRFKMLLSTFGRDGDGELYLADFQGGTVYKLVPAP